jgi:8-oxo-dGTP pyrophosphatase MutT (NUDIX family)
MSKGRVYTHPFGVVGAILARRKYFLFQEFLLVQEAPKPEGFNSDNGKWNQAAGWIEVGEDPLEAIRREVVEETGYDFVPKRILAIRSLVRECEQAGVPVTAHAIKVIYVGKITIPKEGWQRKGSDVQAHKWFSYKEIQRLDREGKLKDPDIVELVKAYRRWWIRFPLNTLRHMDCRDKD